MAIKCVKQLKRDDLADNYEKYVKSGMSEYDAGIQVASDLHRELFDEVADFRATVLGEDAEQAKAKYVPFDTKDINAKYQGIAIERDKQAKLEIEKQKTEAKRVADEAKAEAERAEAARIKAETLKIKVEKKPVPTIQDEPKVNLETAKDTLTPESKPKKTIAKKPLTEIKPQGKKTYWKVEFPTKATVKESVDTPKQTTPPTVGTPVFNALTGQQGEIYTDEDGEMRVRVGKTDAGFYSERNWKPEAPMESAVAQDAEPFYSQLERTIEQKMPERASSGQVKGIIRETKQEERDWLGIDQYLAENPRVTKAELLNFIREHQVKVEEVVKGQDQSTRIKELEDELNRFQEEYQSFEIDLRQAKKVSQEAYDAEYLRQQRMQREWAQKEDELTRLQNGKDDTKFSQYTRDGGENYKELLLTMPRKDAVSSEKRYEQLMDIADRRDLTDDEQQEVEAIERAEFSGQSGRGGEDFRSSHFTEPNILVHIRFDDRTIDGKKVLHIAEIQSDWHQAGRKKGYQMVPDAPFKKSWQELAFKKALRYAVENGYDAVSWDTGETQVERYDLSKQVDYISVETRNNVREVDIHPTGGEVFYLNVDEKGKVVSGTEQFVGKSLDDVIGKDIADKIMSADDKPLLLEGIDLKVGGEGLRAFYDKILPTFVNKYTKKWGGKVEAINLTDTDIHGYDDQWDVILPHGETLSFNGKAEAIVWMENNNKAAADVTLKHIGVPTTPVHFLTIPPAMRESVMQGQPMFRSREEMEASKKSFKNAQKLDIPDLLNIVDVSKMSHDDGIIYMADVPEFELARRVMGNAFNKEWNFDGVFIEPPDVKKIVEAAKGLAQQAKQAGFDGKPFNDLAKLVQDAARVNDGTVIFYIAESALPEEKFHRELFSNRIVENRAQQIPKSTLEKLHAMPVVQDALKDKSTRNSFGSLYGGVNRSKHEQMEEFAVKAALGELNSIVDKRAAAEVAIRYLEAYAENNQTEGVSKDDLLTKLATEITYGEEVKAIQREAEQNKTGAKDSDKQAPDGEKDRPVSGERGEKTGDVTRVTPVLQSREPGKSGVDFDADEAQQVKERGLKVAAFSRIAGQEIYYEPQTNEETEAQAVNLISDIGTQEAIDNALTGKPDAAGMRVVYKEFSRLNALYSYHKEQGNEAEAKVIGEYLASRASAIIERQQATGRESQIARTLDVLSPDIAILMAQRRILNSRGVGATLTDEELAETQELGREAQEIEVKLDKERKALQKSTKKERELDDDTKPSKFVNTQKQLLKDYRKQKTEIVNKLADLFPDSSLFNGETEMMMSAVGDTSKYENLDPTQIEVLTRYATGEILEGLPYENLIKTIEALGVSPTDAQQIHADAVGIIKPSREPRTPEAKERAKIRREHYKQAEKFSSDGNAFLSGIAQDASLDPRYKDNDLLIKAIDFLTNPKNKDKNLNGLINMIRKDNQMSMQDAEKLAHDAREAADTIQAERREKRDKQKNISKEHRKVINELTVKKIKATVKMNQHLRSLGGETDYLVKRFNNVMRGAYVSNYFTQLFNAIQTGTVSVPAEMGLDFIAKMLTGVGINVGENIDIDAKKDLLMPYAYILANDKQMAEQALAHFPEEYFRIHSGILGDIQIEKRAQSDAAHPLTKPFHNVFDFADYGLTKLATVTGAKFQEMYFRNAMIAARFDQIIRSRSGQKETLKSSLENGTFLNYVTQKDAQKAGDDALEVTYASEINDPLGKVLKIAYDKIDNFAPIFLNPVTYARFTYTVTKGMVLNPLLFGALDAQVAGGRGYNNRSIAKGVLGYGGILTAYLLQGMFGGDDDRWDTLYLNGKDKPPISVKRFFPVSSYFYIAHLLRNWKEGGTPPTAKELFEGFASIESDYFTDSAGMELGRAILNYPFANDSKALIAASARLFGNFLSGLGKFFAPMKGVVAQLDDDERVLKEYSDSPKDKFISEVSKSIPFISKLSDAKASRDGTGAPILIPFPIGRAVGLNFVHPSLLSPKDSPATQWANDKFKFKGEMGTMSAEDRKLYQARRRIKNAWRTGNQIAVEQALKNMQIDLSEGSLNRMKDELRYSELGALIKYNFGMDDKGDINNLRKVWSKTTADEKDELREILRKKENLTADFKKEFGLL